jgi:hypothetical protein
MQIKCNYLFFFLCTLLMLTACSKNLRETTLENPDASYRLIIAGDSSDFKDSIRDKVVNNYKDICHIQVVNLDKLEEIDYDQYDAVLIMDTLMAWGGFNQEVKTFINALQDNQKVVVFFSAGDAEAKYSYKGVDAITSASIVSNEDVVVDKLTQKIDLLLSKRK